MVLAAMGFCMLFLMLHFHRSWRRRLRVELLFLRAMAFGRRMVSLCGWVEVLLRRPLWCGVAGFRAVGRGGRVVGLGGRMEVLLGGMLRVLWMELGVFLGMRELRRPVIFRCGAEISCRRQGIHMLARRRRGRRCVKTGGGCKVRPVNRMHGAVHFMRRRHAAWAAVDRHAAWAAVDRHAACAAVERIM